MEVIRILYSKSKYGEYRLIFSDSNLSIEDKNNIYRDGSYCLSKENEILSLNHIMFRLISNNRYIVYKYFKTKKKDCEGRTYFALSGFIVDAIGVRSLPIIGSECAFNLTNYVGKIKDKDKDLLEMFEYDKNAALSFCESELGKKIEKNIKEYMSSEKAPKSFITIIDNKGDTKFKSLDS